MSTEVDTPPLPSFTDAGRAENLKKPETEKKVEAKAEPEKKVEAPKVEDKKASPVGEKKQVQLAEDDDLPDDADIVTMTPKALAARMGRASSKERNKLLAEMKSVLGTADFEELKAKLAKGDEAAKKDDEKRRAEMSEAEKLREDLKKAESRANNLQSELNLTREQHAVEKTENQVTSIALKHITDDEDLLDSALRRYAKHLVSLDSRKAAKIKPKHIAGWFEGLAKEHPKFAKAAAVTNSADDAEAKIVKKKLDNGPKDADEKRPDAKKSGGGADARNFSPSAKNAMSPQEAKAEARKQGYQW